MNRYFFLPLLSLLLLGVGCGAQRQVPNTDALQDLSNQIEALEQDAQETVEVQVDINEENGEVTEVESELPEEGDELEEGESATVSVSMEAGNFFFSPSTITASPGQEVSLSFASVSGTHTFVIDEIGFKEGINTGSVLTFTAPTAPGSYAYYCDVGSHRALGMEGVLFVQ